MKRTLLSWSSGKDSAWSLHLLREQNEFEIFGLLTTFNQAANRVAMHAVRRSLVEAQAEAIGIPLWDVDLPWPCSNADYESIMKETCKAAVQAGIDHIAFGDLFLADIRAYREKQLENSGLQPIFPVWGMPPRELAHSMIESGVHAKLTCVDPKVLAAEFVGREFDEQLLSDLPPQIDPCGENGEFHTFVYAGPMFRHDLSIEVGEIVCRDGFVFADLSLSQNKVKVRKLRERPFDPPRLRVSGVPWSLRLAFDFWLYGTSSVP
jgi:uncharacterized protein (TIGR00290 family)